MKETMFKARVVRSVAQDDMRLASFEEVCELISYLCNQAVTESNFHELLSLCRDHLSKMGGLVCLAKGGAISSSPAKQETPAPSPAKQETPAQGTQEHPKAKEARLKNLVKEAKRVQNEAVSKEAVSHALNCGYRFLICGDMTVCYKQAGAIVYISTAVRNSKDRFSKIIGKATAWERIKISQFILVKLPSSSSSAYHIVKRMFS